MNRPTRIHPSADTDAPSLNRDLAAASTHPPASPLVIISRAPDPRVMRFFNAIIRALLRSQLHRLLSEHLLLLTSRGRMGVVMVSIIPEPRYVSTEEKKEARYVQ